MFSAYAAQLNGYLFQKYRCQRLLKWEALLDLALSFCQRCSFVLFCMSRLTSAECAPLIPFDISPSSFAADDSSLFGLSRQRNQAKANMGTVETVLPARR